MVQSIIKEIGLRRNFLREKNLTSIYFGGGTPSLLDQKDLSDIFNALSAYYTWGEATEITLEANPDDLDSEYLHMLSNSPVNRLSIGIQSFEDADLKFMNRAHNAYEAQNCLKLAQDVGLDNISADLIYGSETTTDRMWARNIDKLVSLDIPHISAYCLTIEENTALHHFVRTGKAQPTNDEKSSRQFYHLLERMRSDSYSHYEISNYSKPGKEAIHNSNYWKGFEYLGLGPAAHSYNGINERSWNIAHNPKYIEALNNEELPRETEQLTKADQYNEYVLIRLRTKWGILEDDIHRKYPEFANHLFTSIAQHIDSGNVISDDCAFILTDQGKLRADGIASDLFVEE